MPLLPVKVVCVCGQKYSFEVEPVNGRMPSRVACPVCGVDGTGTANEILARTHTAPPPAPAAIAPLAPAASQAAAETGAQRLSRELKAHTGAHEEDKWKWYYYVIAGVLIGAYSIWQFYNTHRPKVLGELILAVFCIFVGVWSFQAKRKKQQ